MDAAISSQALSDRLDELTAELRQERHRREAGEAVLQKAILLCAQQREVSHDRGANAGTEESERTPSAGSSPLRGSPANAGMVEELLRSFEELRAEDAACDQAITLGAAAAAAQPCGSSSAATLPAANSSTVPPASCEDHLPQQALDGTGGSGTSGCASPQTARDAYEELFVKKARCFEQAVNMIEATAASVTKRLEAVVSESSAAMRREACDRAQAKAEIQRALLEIRHASDRASENALLGMPGHKPSSGAPGEGRGDDSSLIDAARMTLARSGSDLTTLGAAASSKVSHSPPIPGGSGNVGVIRVSSQPQRMMRQDIPGYNMLDPSFVEEMGACVVTATDLSAISEQEVLNQHSPRKHVVLAPKVGASSGFGQSAASPSGSSSLTHNQAGAMQAGYGGSALFRQGQKQSAAPPPTVPAAASATTEASQNPQSVLIAATPRPGKQYPGVQPQYHGAPPAGLSAGRQAAPLQSPQQPQGAPRPVSWPQQQGVPPGVPPGHMQRAGDATPVAVRPGSVPPGLRVPGRSLAAGAAVMRFTSK